MRASYPRLVSAAPNNPYYRANFANALAGLNQWQQAFKEIGEAVRLEPSNSEFREFYEQVESRRLHETASD